MSCFLCKSNCPEWSSQIVSPSQNRKGTENKKSKNLFGSWILKVEGGRISWDGLVSFFKFYSIHIITVALLQLHLKLSEIFLLFSKENRKFNIFACSILFKFCSSLATKPNHCFLSGQAYVVPLAGVVRFIETLRIQKKIWCNDNQSSFTKFFCPYFIY